MLPDRLDPEGRRVLIAVACDGAGSASQILDGATLTIDRFLREFSEATSHLGLDGITKEFVEDWLSRVRAEIRDREKIVDLSPREFACNRRASSRRPGSSRVLSDW